ncbi:YfcL family protein, partial [Klebsiella variicola]
TCCQGLEKAMGAGELSPRDQALVNDMWEHLFQQASQQ